MNGRAIPREKFNQFWTEFFLLIYFNNHPLYVSRRVIMHHQQPVTVYAAYGIYRSDNTKIM